VARMRVSPHVFNDEADADRFAAAVATQLQAARP
jgi:selenocysteine lyase/cysteine desulfurase